MYLIVLVLNKVELLEKVLENLSRVGVPGATILDSTGMGRALSESVPESLLTGLQALFQHSRPHNKTIFSVIESKEKKDRALAAINEILGDMSRPGIGIMFTITLLDVIGLYQSEHN
jgi:nitrogen regulatory protein PII